MREQDRAAGDDIGAPAVLMDTRPDVEWRRRDIAGDAVGRPQHQHAPAALGRATLDPIDVVTVDPGVAEAHDLTHQVIDPDR